MHDLYSMHHTVHESKHMPLALWVYMQESTCTVAPNTWSPPWQPLAKHKLHCSQLGLPMATRWAFPRLSMGQPDSSWCC